MRYVMTVRSLAGPLAHWRAAIADRPLSPFSAKIGDTYQLLDRELTHLEARDVFMQLVCEPGQIRGDGWLRANARVDHPGVVLTIDTKHHGSLVYETDAFTERHGAWSNGWAANLRAIALGLEALRKVERYGIARRGQQYAGYREIGTGIALGPAAMTEAEALRLLDLSHRPSAGADEITARWRQLAKDHHPDAGGDPATFRRLTEARDFLVGRP